MGSMHGGVAANAGGANAQGTGRAWKSWDSASTGGKAEPQRWQAWNSAKTGGKPEDPWYLDATYTRNLADHDYNKDLTLAEVKAAMAQQRMGRSRGMRDLGRMYQQARTNAAASHGAAGLGSSGIQAKAQMDMSRDFNTGTSDIGKDYTAAVAALNRQAELARQRYASSKAGEIGIAKQRWEYLNPGMAPPR